MNNYQSNIKSFRKIEGIIGLLGVLFASLSFFEIYLYVLEPIKLHHLVAIIFPDWFVEFSSLYKKHQNGRANEYIIMLIWAKFLGILTGIIICFIYHKQISYHLFTDKFIKRKKWIQILKILLLFLMLLLAFLFVLTNGTQEGDHVSSFYATKILTNYGFFTYILYFATCASAITMLFSIKGFIGYLLNLKNSSNA